MFNHLVSMDQTMQDLSILATGKSFFYAISL